MSDLHDALLDAVAAWLVDAALLDGVARARASGDALTPDDDAVMSLARHGSPYRPLLGVVDGRALVVSWEGPRVTALRALSDAQLRREWDAVRRKGLDLLVERTRLGPRPPRATPQVTIPREDVPSVPTPEFAERVARASERLERTLARWFAPPSATASPDPDAAIERGPTSWLEVAPSHDGAWTVWAVIAPIGDLLPPSVRALSLRGGATSASLRRENVASSGGRLPVAPGSAWIGWSTGAFDDALSDELARLAIAPLSRTHTTVFRTDVEGSAQRLDGRVVTPGRSYQVVVPRDGSWEVRALDVPPEVPDALRASLTAMGLTLGASAMSWTWMGEAPEAWRTNARGARYACLCPGDTVHARLDAGRDVCAGEVAVLLVGPHGSTHASLPAGRVWEIALEDLGPGCHALEALSPDRTLEPSRWVFEVLAESLSAPSMALWVQCGDVRVASDETHALDLAAALPDDAVIEVRAPVAMGVDLRWRGASSWQVFDRTAGTDGIVDVGAAHGLLAQSLASDRVGVLSIDFGEWGVTHLTHEARWSPHRAASLRATWHALLRDGVSLRTSVLSSPELVRSAWVDRAARALGYSLADAPSSAPWIDGGAAWLLREHACEGIAVRVRREVPLVLVPAIDRATWGASTLRRTVERFAAAVGAVEVIVTDVEGWWRLDPMRGRLGRAERLAEVLDDDERFEDFACATFGAWR